MSKSLRTGGCLCGAVRYSVAGALRPVVVCHCTQCRRMTGHVMAATAARRADFRPGAEGGLEWYAGANEARPGVCGRCGRPVLGGGGGRDYISIGAGSLDASRALTVPCHIFVADKGDYYEI